MSNPTWRLALTSRSNCGAKFIAYYGYDEENVETVEVRLCGLCHSETLRSDNFQERDHPGLVAEVTARR